MDEIIKETKYKDYFVSNIGNVYSCKYGKLKEMKLDYNYGYAYVNIYENGKRTHCRVHRLIAETFISNPNNYPVVNHKDGNKSNNNVSNLEWCTISYNTKHAFDNGLAVNDKGFDDSQSNPVISINLKDGFISIFGSMRNASKTLNTSVSTISSQIKGKTKCDNRSKYKFLRYI